MLIGLIEMFNHLGINLCSYEDGSFLVVQMATEDASVLWAIEMADGDATPYYFVKGQRVERPPEAYPKWIRHVIRYRQALYDVTLARNFTIEGIAI